MELPNIVRMEHFATLQEYTEMGNLSVATVHNRIRSKSIAYLRIGGKVMIDIRTSPPKRTYYKKHRAPELPVLTAAVNVKELIHVISYCNRKSRRANFVFNAILTGRIRGVILGNEIFAYKHEVESLK
jgi:hypothetical protein